MKLITCIGIGDYPGTDADLPGCVPDAIDTLDELQSWGYRELRLLTNADATREHVLQSLREICVQLGPGDVGWWQISSHGTRVTDRDGDERDRLDEAIYCVDGQVVIDDELRAVIAETLHSEATLVVDGDLCHGGTLLRGAWRREADLHRLLGREVPPRPRVRYLAPADPDEALRAAANPPRLGFGALWRRHLPNVALLAPCRPAEFSYDLGTNGAFTAALLGVLRAARVEGGGLTLGELMARVQQVLPSPSLPQHPRLECRGVLRGLEI